MSRFADRHSEARLPASSHLNELFNAYGDLGDHWTGGDETMSVRLPGGDRVAWFFGDTMMGEVNADGSRPPGQPMIHNSVVIQEGGALTRTLHEGTVAHPRSYVGSGTDVESGEFGWWPGEARVLSEDALEVFYTRVWRAAGGGALSFMTVDRSIARFALPSMALAELTALTLPSNAWIGWGAAMVDGDDGKTYVYGTERIGKVDKLYVARTPQGSLVDASRWEFLTGSQWGAPRWSSNDGDARPIMTGVGAGFSVKRIKDQYVLVTLDTDEVFSNEVVAYFARGPAGPFAHRTSLYRAPETAVPDVWVYNARLHPEQTWSETELVVSYNVGSFRPGAMDAAVHLYRPKFVTVRLQPPAGGRP